MLRPRLARLLHLLRGFDSKQGEGAHELRFDQLRQLKQEGAFLLIGLRKNVTLVVKVVKQLRKLKLIFRYERRLLRSDGSIHGIIKRTGSKHQLPKICAIGPRKHLTGWIEI